MCLNRPVIDNLSPEVQEYITCLETDLEEQKNRIADLEIMLQNTNNNNYAEQHIIRRWRIHNTGSSLISISPVQTNPQNHARN